MTDIVCKPFGECGETAEGLYPLFGFAVEDYIATYGITYEEAEDYAVFGAVLDKCFHDDWQLILLLEFVTNPANEKLKLLVFDVYNDIYNLTKDEIDDVIKNVNGLNGFTLLENVYENRIVFARR